MKKIVAVLSFALFFITGSVMAQNGGNQQTPEQRVVRMKEMLKDLNLTTVQMDSVLAITGDISARQRPVFMDQALSEDEKGSKMGTLMDERNKRLEKTLGVDLSKKVIEVFAQQRRSNRPAGRR